jgi:hypothetical protein
MKNKQSWKIGRKHALRSAFFIFLLFELILLYSETQGDFANGILFFIEKQMNLFSLLVYVVFFLVHIILGQEAGYRILDKKVSAVGLAVLYALLSTLIVVVVCSVSLFQTLIQLQKGMYLVAEKNQLITSFILLSGCILLAFLCGWLFTARQIKREGIKGLSDLK